MLVLARLAVRLMPMSRILKWADRPPRRIRRFTCDERAWVAWAIDSAAAKPWIAAPCLPQALAAHAMLRRRGIASRVCLGVAGVPDQIMAHAWVEVGEDRIIGGAGAEAFTRLAAFGGPC